MHKWLPAHLLILALVAAGCATDGRVLAEPGPDQTTTTRPPPPTSAPPSEEGVDGLALSIPNFEPGAAPPASITCSGGNTWPELRWENIPATANELAVTLTNQTNPEEPLLLWLVAGISPTESGIDAGRLPAGSFVTLNDYGNLGWGDPCLDPLTDSPTDYQFRLHVLEFPSGLEEGGPGNEAWDTLNAAAVDSASVLMRTGAPAPVPDPSDDVAPSEPPSDATGPSDSYNPAACPIPIVTARTTAAHVIVCADDAGATWFVTVDRAGTQPETRLAACQLDPGVFQAEDLAADRLYEVDTVVGERRVFDLDGTLIETAPLEAEVMYDSAVAVNACS